MFLVLRLHYKCERLQPNQYLLVMISFNGIFFLMLFKFRGTKQSELIWWQGEWETFIKFRHLMDTNFVF